MSVFMPILTVGEKFPEFDLTALKGGDLHDVNANLLEVILRLVCAAASRNDFTAYAESVRWRRTKRNPR